MAVAEERGEEQDDENVQPSSLSAVSEFDSLPTRTTELPGGSGDTLTYQTLDIGQTCANVEKDVNEVLRPELPAQATDDSLAAARSHDKVALPKVCYSHALPVFALRTR